MAFASPILWLLRRAAVVAAGLLAVAGIAPAAAQFTGAASGHPAEDYRRAASLFQEGARDEAVGWFYRGQLRARIHLAARPELAPDGDPALIASLNEVVGRPINAYAFGDIDKLVATLDRVVAWHAAHDDPFTPKGRFSAAHARVVAGLAKLRAYALERRDDIRRERIKNGLPNSP